MLTLTRRSREGGGGEDGAEAITSGSMCMKSWIGPRVVESIRGRGNLASRGLIRSRLEPVVAGSTRSRLDPALGRVDPLAAWPGGGRINPFTA